MVHHACGARSLLCSENLEYFFSFVEAGPTIFWLHSVHLSFVQEFFFFIDHVEDSLLWPMYME